jgi:hypothetical protein
MPMHDWTRVAPGTYHNFHYRWIAAMMDRLNAGTLPAGYFAMAEQRVGGPEPDVITLAARDPEPPDGGGAPTLAPPRTAIVERAENVRYARKTNRIAIHHGLGTVVAVIELVSPGNKDTRHALRSFARKAAALIRNGVHLLVIDPFPPGRYDPQGIHRAVWEQVTETTFSLPPGKPLTVVSYQAGIVPTAYLEPTAVGDPVPAMPLFLDDELYVTVPLEETYVATWAVLPAILRDLMRPAE